MGWDDKKWRGFAWGDKGFPAPMAPLPTRSGEPSGGSNERVMLDKHNQNTISKSFRNGTMLVTRGGMPHFSNRRMETESVTQRGFVFSENAGPQGRVFNCYTISELQKTNFVSIGYSVLPFSSQEKIQAPAWAAMNDVALSVGNGVYINGLVSQRINFNAVPLEGMMLPAILRKQGGYFYGNTGESVNGYLVGRYSVQPPSGEAFVMSPASPRPEKRCITYGQDLSNYGESNQSQFYYTGGSWDSLASIWKMSTMRCVFVENAPFATKTDADFFITAPSCIPLLQGSGAINETVSGGSVSAVSALIGYYGAVEPYAFEFGYYQGYRCKATPSELYYHNIPWVRYLTGGFSNYADTKVFTTTFRGEPVYYEATMQFSEKSLNESAGVVAQALWGDDLKSCDYHLRDGPIGLGYPIYKESTVNPQYSSGVATKFSQVVASDSSGVSANRVEKEYSGSFSITHDGDYFVYGDFYRFDESGSRINAFASSANASAFSAHIGDENTYDTKSVSRYVNVTNEEHVSLNVPLIDSWVGQPINFGYVSGVVDNKPLDFSVNNFGTAPTKTILNWGTKDFVLHDKPNEVFVYVKSDFAGSDGSANLTIKLVVDTPSGTAEVVLLSKTLQFSLPLLDTLTPNTVPPPRLTGFCGSYYYHQGAMHGAAYIESSESCDPAYLFDFNIRMRGFDAIQSVDLGAHDAIDFIPANLLEMLYAYVFSSWYGWKNNERYPVTRGGVFAEFQQELFGVNFRVSYRDGVLGSWVAPLTTSNNAHFDIGRI